MYSLIIGSLLYIALPLSSVASLSGFLLPLFLRCLGPLGIQAALHNDLQPHPTLQVLFLLVLCTVLGTLFELSVDFWGFVLRPLLHRFAWYRTMQLRALSLTGLELYRAGYTADEMEMALFTRVPCCDGVQELRPGSSICFSGEE